MSELHEESESSLQDPREAESPMEAQFIWVGEEEGGEVEEEKEMEVEEEVASLSPSSLLSSSSSEGAKSMHPDSLHLLVVELVHFLLLKYCTKEPTTKDEILNMVLKEDGHHFPEAFRQASDCLQLVFGVDVREVDHTKHTYMLVPTLGLTCNGMVSDGHSMPKTSFLVVVLGMILLEGNCALEEEIWETLNDMGVYAGREHYIYGEPRKLLTQMWVQEGYLEYQMAPHSDPVHYEFLWGPRAYAETSKWHVLEHLLRIKQGASRSFLLPSSKAAREEEVGP
ncbi:unnamed protein product [Rangifer tarandus platyrhynchus]|uniref:MAGE domain-containing protein n=1 Tax=Rangifer tarandus platyrhynchus TaxID=3082113 RepID=A0ABN9A6H5_RANTA|nr:unnamed protein product [Rangifer tarandus platyrhynchus]